MNTAILAVLLLFPGSPVRAEVEPEMDRLYMQYLDLVFSLKLERAETVAKEVIEKFPEHPAGYFGLAGIAWTRYVYETDQSDPALMAPFEAKVEEVGRVGALWLKKHPQDPLAMMVMGAAYGIKSRILTVRKEWIKAYLVGRKAIGITREAVKLNPDFHDAYLGVGMYDYYSDVYQRVIGVLAKMILGGNRLRGIDTLKMVAEKGHFSKACAQILLVEIYTEDAFGARDPEKAVALMRELLIRYPDSAMMHSAFLVSLFEAKHYEETAQESRRYLKNVELNSYKPIEKAKGAVSLGCALWALGRKEEALAAYLDAATVTYNGGPSRWAVWAMLRAANLLDHLGRREEAIKHYKTVAAMPNRWGFNALAKAGLSKPYASDQPGTIPPHFN